MSDTPIKVCVVTGSRSEYGLLRWLMQEFKDHPAFDLRLVVTGSHLSEDRGRTIDNIKGDGFSVDVVVEVELDTRSDAALTQAVAAMTRDIAAVFEAHRPDLAVIMGDRYEMLGVGAACVLMTIPIAHISGGEITAGAIDDQIRHALTKMAHLHIVANDDYARRVRQMGEEDWRVCACGEPGLDNVTRLGLWTDKKLGDDLGIDLSKPTALVTYHPVTLERDKLDQQVGALIEALQRADLQYVLTYPNADLGSDRIIEALKTFADANQDRVRLVKNLGQTRYLSVLRHASLMIGNSSSALFEAPSFNLPAVNLGSRQGGRMRGANVIDTECETEAILAGIDRALDYDRSGECLNPYGDGHSSERARVFIENVFARHDAGKLLKKKFVDLPA